VLQTIYKSFHSLPPKMGKVFRMLYIEGKDYKQIAEELNTTVNAVRNQKAKGLLLLREKLPPALSILLLHRF
jgi:RNA polymerase sigma-70 factor (ECF subfamily)